MEKIVISVLLAIIVGGAAVAGMHYLSAGNKDTDPEAVAALRSELAGTRKAVTELKDEVRRLAVSHNKLVNSLSVRSDEGKSLPSEVKDEGGQVVAATPELRDEVFALIAEERAMRDEERQKQREEADKRREERRKEIEELSKGPYDRLNLKVNSMAKALAMDDTQRDKYFEITKKFRDKMEADRQAFFAQIRDQNRDPNQPADQAGKRPGGRGPGRESFEKLRELMDATQKDYAAEVQGILTAQQVATFNELSQSSQSFMGTGMAGNDGGDDGGFGGRFGEMSRGQAGPPQGRQRGGATGRGRG